MVIKEWRGGKGKASESLVAVWASEYVSCMSIVYTVRAGASFYHLRTCITLYEVVGPCTYCTGDLNVSKTSVR